MYKLFVKVREEGLPISGPMLKEKAVKYAEQLGVENFTASNGWFGRWKNRHGIVFKTFYGEAKSCTPDISASWEETTLPTILSNCALRDIFNADEFGLFYKALPDKSLQLKSEKCVGGKHSKVRLTALAAGNAEDEKLPMFVIGKSVKPRCFSGIVNLPCRYRAQKKSWMDSTLFEEWVREQDPKFEREGRKVAFIVDNCPAHPTISNLKAINLVFLPPNTTSKTQPMDQGFIGSLKAYYRATCVRKILDAVDNGKPKLNFSVLDGMIILVEAWNKVKKETVQNCFRKPGIGSSAQQSALNDDDDPFKTLSEEINALREENPQLLDDRIESEDLVSTDGNVLTSESLTDNDILAEFQDQDCNNKSDGEPDGYETVPEVCPTQPTKTEVRQATDTLLRFSLSRIVTGMVPEVTRALTPRN